MIRWRGSDGLAVLAWPDGKKLRYRIYDRNYSVGRSCLVLSHWTVAPDFQSIGAMLEAVRTSVKRVLDSPLELDGFHSVSAQPDWLRANKDTLLERLCESIDCV